MPILAGWLTGTQVPEEVIAQTLTTMGEILARHGGTMSRTIQPGAGFIAFADSAYTSAHQSEQAILDWLPEQRTFSYRRPLSGQHPLYYRQDWPAEGNLLFASEIKALLALGMPRRFNGAALLHLQRYGFIPAPWTIFQDIYTVPSGALLRWHRAQTLLNQNVDYPLTPLTTSLTEITQTLQHTLEQSCFALLPNHEQVCALVDNKAASMLVAQFFSNTDMELPFFSLVYKKPSNSRAWQQLEEFADSCEQPLFIVNGVDQVDYWATVMMTLETPVVETRALALHELYHTLAQQSGARVAITGSGFSSLFGLTSSAIPIDQSPHISIWQQYTHYRHTSNQHIENVLSAELLQSVQHAEPWEETRYARKLAHKAEQLPDAQVRMHYLDMHLHFSEKIRRAEHLAQQERLALKSPFLDASLVNLFTQLSATYKNQQEKQDFLAALLHNTLPNISLERENLPLHLGTATFAQPWQSELLHEFLSEQALKETGIFNSETVQMLLQQPVVNHRMLLLVFTTQLLYRLFQIEGW